MTYSTPLINLALLEALKGKKVIDEIDLFLPFLALAICNIEGESFDIKEVKNEFSKRFKFSPPNQALQVILTRAKKNGLIRLKNHQFFKVPEKLNKINETNIEKEKEIENSVNLLKLDFVNYAKNSHQITIENDTAELLIFEFLQKNISDYTDILVGEKVEKNIKIKNKHYLTACYIRHISNNEMNRKFDLERIIKGILLANYITFADKTSTKNNLDNITIYLDAPIVLGLLGFSGIMRKKSLNEVLSLMFELSVNVCMFDISLDEIKVLFRAWRDDLRNNIYDRFNPKTLELLKSIGLDANGLDTEIILINSRVSNLKIKIINGYSIDQKHQCDEKELKEELGKFFKNRDLQHDTLAVSRIHNSRKSTLIDSLDKKFSIFISINKKLVEIVNAYFSELSEKGSIPVVASEKWLATILWLRNPNAFKGMPFNCVLANAYSTIYSDDRFWKSFIKKLENIRKRGDISEDDFKVVRYDKTLLEKVHDTSIEAGEDFSDEDIYDIVKSIKEKSDNKKNEEILAIEEQKNKEISEIKNEKQSIELKYSLKSSKIEKITSIMSHSFALLLTGMFLYLLFYASCLSIPEKSKISSTAFEVSSLCGTFSIIAFLFFSFLNIIFGSTLKGIYIWVQKKVNRKILSYFD